MFKTTNKYLAAVSAASVIFMSIIFSRPGFGADLILLKKHSSFKGNTTTEAFYFEKDKIKFHTQSKFGNFKNEGTVIIRKDLNLKWRLNIKNRTYYETAFQGPESPTDNKQANKFLNAYMKNSRFIEDKHIVNRNITKTICGHTCQLYTVKVKEKGMPFTWIMNYWAAQDMKVTSEILNHFNHLQGASIRGDNLMRVIKLMVHTKMYPCQIKFKRSNERGWSDVFTLIKFETKKVDKDFFKLPKGFTKK